MKVKAYQIPDTSPQYLATSIESWFRAENFETQTLSGPEDTFIVQGRRDNLIRFFFGLSAALTVTIGNQPDGALTVAIGASSWVDKYLAGFAGVFLFAPFAFTAVYGVWKQDDLEDRLWTYISKRLPGAVEVAVQVPTPPFKPVQLTPQGE